MRGRALAFLAVVSMMVSCSQSSEVEGRVSDVTTNTLTITGNDGSITTFSTRKARVNTPAGIHRGSPVKVEYDDDISDGFGNARKVTAPEKYNLLIGRWLYPGTENPDLLIGFELCEGGEAVDHQGLSIVCCHWALLDNNTLILTEGDDPYGEENEFVQHWQIEQLDNNLLTINRCGVRLKLARCPR